MKLIFTSYASSPEYNHPNLWLKRIEGYTGILEHLGRNNKVIGIERINYEGECERNGVQYLFIRFNSKVARFPFRMHNLVKKLKPDVVFINGFIFPLQIIQLRLTLGRSVKIIVLHRAEKPFSGIKRYLQKMADKAVDAYLFTTAEFGNDWKRNINVKKIHEVIQGSSVFRPINKTEDEQVIVNGLPVYLWVGRLDANKDPLTIIKAFLTFLKSYPDAKLYLIYQGDELLQEVMKLIRSDEKGTDAIRLVGKVFHQQMQDWYNRAGFIISGSHYEGSGIAVCEAMSCGCIPIVTDILSFRKMTGPDKCGLLFEAGNENDLLAALLKTRNMDMENERKKVLHQFNKELSFEAIATRINRIIENV